MEVTPVELGKSHDDKIQKIPSKEEDLDKNDSELAEEKDEPLNEPVADSKLANDKLKVNENEHSNGVGTISSVDVNQDVSNDSSETYEPAEVVKDSKDLVDNDSDSVDNKEADNDEDDDYDPENINLSSSYPSKDNHSDNTSEDDIDVYRHPEDNVDEAVEEADDYDPEAEFSKADHTVKVSEKPKEQTSTNQSTSKLKPPPAGLPPKPPVSANFLRGSSHSSIDPQQQLKEAYEAIMNSDLVKDPRFVNLSHEEQMKLIMDQLNKNNVTIGNTPGMMQRGSMNYNQVYSYNKPFKNLKNPIPLVPVNEFCRRPNITAPMTPEEERLYEEFIKRESEYMKLQNWDEFPEKLRLFIGNLPANTISKQDLFRIFSQYGEVIQIAIKAGYGFAQFRTAEACLECIKGETNVPLHNKIMRLDASSPQKTKKQGNKNDSSNFGSRARESSPDLGIAEDSNKRRKQIPDCKIYVTGKSSVFFIRKVKKSFSSLQILTDTEDITHRDLNDVISEAAYSGVLGICIVKEQKVDVQVFESTEDGGIKFDEYADIDPDLAADIISKTKISKYGELPQQIQEKHLPEPYYSNYQSGVNEPYNSRRNDYNNHRRSDRYDSYSERYQERGNGSNHHGNHGNHSNNGRGNWSQPFDRNLYGNPSGNIAGSQYTSNNQYSQISPAPYGKAPQPPSNINQDQKEPTNNLLQTLQNLDPASMQNMISILQQQQQQQQGIGLAQSIPPINYGQPNGPPLSSTNQVNAILSHLQSTSGTFNSSNSNQSQYQNQSQSKSNTTLSLMETLARLGRK